MEKKLGIMFFLFVVLLLQFSELRTAQRPSQVDKEEGTLMPYIDPHGSCMSMVLYIYICMYMRIRIYKFSYDLFVIYT